MLSNAPEAMAGRLLGIDLWASPQANPCEVRFRYAEGDAGRPALAPAALEVHVGGTLFGLLSLERCVVAAVADSDADEPPVSDVDAEEGA